MGTGLLGYPINPVCKNFGLINKYTLMKNKNKTKVLVTVPP